MSATVTAVQWPTEEDLRSAVDKLYAGIDAVERLNLVLHAAIKQYEEGPGPEPGVTLETIGALHEHIDDLECDSLTLEHHLKELRRNVSGLTSMRREAAV